MVDNIVYGYNQMKRERSHDMCSMFAPSASLSDYWNIKLGEDWFFGLREYCATKGYKPGKGRSTYNGVRHTVDYRNIKYPDKQSKYVMHNDWSDMNLAIQGHSLIITHDIAIEWVKDRMDGVLDMDGSDPITIGKLDHATNLRRNNGFYVKDIISGWREDILPNEYKIPHLRDLRDSNIVKKIFYSIVPDGMIAKKKVVLHHSATPRDQELLTALKAFDKAHYQRFVESYAGTGSEQPSANIHYKGVYVGNIAYNFVISADGEVAPCRPLHMLGYHCGDLSMNRESNAICCLGNFEKEHPTQAQIEAIKKLQEQYNWEAIYGHKDIKTTACPGKNFPLQEMKSLSIKNLDMFYKNLRETYIKPLPEEQKAFKDPAGAVEKFKEYTHDKKREEIMYLLAVISQQGIGK